MSEITCPFCSAALFESELASGECTSCMQKLPRRRTETLERRSGWARASDREGKGWQGVRIGVGLLLLAVGIVVVLGPLLVVGTWVYEEYWRWSDDLGLGAFLLGFGLFGLFVAGMAGLVGLVLSLSAPGRAALRHHAIGAGVGLALGPMVIASPFVLVELTRHRIVSQFEWLLLLMLFGGIFLVLAAWVWYCVYLRGVARYFADEPLALGFVALGIATVVLVLLGFGLFVVLRTLFRFYSSDQELILTLGSGFLGLILLVWLGLMLFRLFRRIPSLNWRALAQAED